MKKLLTLVVAILAVSLYSCGKDEKKVDENSSNPFIGTWKLEEIVMEGENIHLDECLKQTTYVFTDTNMKITSLNRMSNSTECETKTQEISYSILGNKIIAKDIEYTFLIKDNTLTLFGLTEDTKKTFTMTLKKQ